MALMAEPVPASDKTAALDGDKTAAVPSPAPTDTVETAWSREQDVSDVRGPGPDLPDVPDIPDGRGEELAAEPASLVQSWRTTLARAAALLLLGLGFAAVIVIGGWALSTESSPGKASKPRSVTQIAPTPTSAPTTTTTIASTPEQDSAYIAALNDRGISFANPNAAIYNGKLVCENFRRGLTVDEIVAAFRSSNPALSNHAGDYVDISMRTYCP
ncbi:putative secreted protein [Mycobacterium liflandii 128FXT]|uniref:Secreted protein n=2 Tax=Mycobacterium TaxID=1763 RepID=L7V8A1_MYCL1|nr:putative secreted protein [Mycobacterium liflandii 128FXT]